MDYFFDALASCISSHTALFNLSYLEYRRPTQLAICSTQSILLPHGVLGFWGFGVLGNTIFEITIFT